MPKALLYLLLFSYTTIICKPVLPALSDAIAHVFWYSEHMATVHYEHGKYHVHYEYQQAAKNEFPGKDTSLPKSTDTVSEHIAGSNAYQPFRQPAVIDYFSLPLQGLFCTILDSDVPPPKA
jgi:hypothetical protein